eukprot:759577-Hanusia_phi.AAC.1
MPGRTRRQRPVHRGDGHEPRRSHGVKSIWPAVTPGQQITIPIISAEDGMPTLHVTCLTVRSAARYSVCRPSEFGCAPIGWLRQIRLRREDRTVPRGRRAVSSFEP